MGSVTVDLEFEPWWNRGASVGYLVGMIASVLDTGPWQTMWDWLNQSSVIGMLLLAGATVAWRNLWFAYDSRRWPTTAARIDYLGLVEGRREGRYRLVVRYSYVVGGTSYECTRWRFGSGVSGNMQDIAVGSTQIKPVGPVVFYDPNRPGRACLVAGPDEMTFGIPIAASLVGLSALVAGIF